MLSPVIPIPIPIPIRSGANGDLPVWALASVIGLCGLFIVTLGLVVWHWWRNP